jgi:hypothetical protein
MLDQILATLFREIALTHKPPQAKTFGGRAKRVWPGGRGGGVKEKGSGICYLSNKLLKLIV